MAQLTSALQRLRDLWAAGQHRKALALAAKWHDLGTAKDAITRGHAAANNPAIYREMNKDPDQLVRDGLAALCSRYQLPQGE